jgi:hypothetical protein
MARKKGIKDYTALGTLSAQLVLRNLPFVFFLAFLAVIYIANAHYSERTVREIQGLQDELKELRWKYMSLKSELMYNSMQSEVEKKALEEGLSQGRNLPKKIIIEE